MQKSEFPKMHHYVGFLQIRSQIRNVFLKLNNFPYIISVSVKLCLLKLQEARIATGRPKRSISKPNYRELSDVQLPKERKQQANVQRKDLGNDRMIYRLNVLEEDESRGLVKISYIGYGSEWDEWRRHEDLIELNEEDVDDEDDAMDSCAMQQSLQMSPLNLYEQLATNIKLQLLSYRKRNPYCHISLNFDFIYFEGLIQRGSVISRTKREKTSVHSHQFFQV